MKFLKKLNMFQKYKERKQKEQNKHTMNMLLLQKLVTIYEQKNMTVQHFNTGSCLQTKAARVNTQDGKFVYEVAYTRMQNGNYFVEIPNGETGTNKFGFYEGDSGFRDNKHNYMQAVHDLVYDGSYGPGIADLMNKKIDQNLDIKTLSLPSQDLDRSDYIEAFQYLNNFLTKTK